MRAVAQARPKITQDDLDLLAWLRDNRETLGTLIPDAPMLRDIAENYRTHLADQGTEIAVPMQYPDRTRELDGMTPVLHDGPDGLELVSPNAPADLAPAEPPAPERVPGVVEATPPVAIGNCSVCLGPIYDLDAPCETCIQAGRLTPDASPADLHAAQSDAAHPYAQAPTIHDAPRISNATTRAPIPAPDPPSRAYTASETCRSCGRLPELHVSHGGPIGHVFEAQPQPA